MQTISAFCTFLICLTALTLLNSPSQAQNSNPQKGKPGQFTNGQSGTPNLPIAPTMIVDKNNMLRAINLNIEHSSHSVNHRENLLRSLFFLAYKVAVNRANGINPQVAVDRANGINPQSDSADLRSVIEELYSEVQKDVMQYPLPEHYSYAGAEARAGADKPIYVPEMIYGDVRSGLEFGMAGYLQSAYTDGVSRRDSLGLSLKYIPWSFAAHNVGQDDEVGQILQQIDYLDLDPDLDPAHKKTTIQSLDKILSDKNVTDKVKDKDILNSLDIVPGAEQTEGYVPIAVRNRLRELILEFDAKNADDLKDFADGTRRPASAFVVSDQHFSGGGDVFNAGATVSRLYPFSKGGPGVTAVAVAQYFHDNLGDSVHRSAERLGLAAIYQDTTLKLVTLVTKPEYAGTHSADEADAVPIKELGPPWHYKIGVEYTSPLLGLHETGAVFAHYRWTPSYWELTTTYGKDGLRKDYVDVSIGRSFLF